MDARHLPPVCAGARAVAPTGVYQLLMTDLRRERQSQSQRATAHRWANHSSAAPLLLSTCLSAAAPTTSHGLGDKSPPSV